MMVPIDPCGRCRPCQDGKICCNTLSLSPKDEADLRRVALVLGAQLERPIVSLRPAREKSRPAAPDPTDHVTCRTCRTIFQMLAHLATFVKSYSVQIQCEVCR